MDNHEKMTINPVREQIALVLYEQRAKLHNAYLYESFKLGIHDRNRMVRARARYYLIRDFGISW